MQIVRWRFGGFAFSDQANIKIYSAMDGVKKVPLSPQLKFNPAAQPGILQKRQDSSTLEVLPFLQKTAGAKRRAGINFSCKVSPKRDHAVIPLSAEPDFLRKATKIMLGLVKNMEWRASTDAVRSHKCLILISGQIP